MDCPKVRGKRNELKLSQEYVSKQLGITLKTYNLKENGKSDFTINEIVKLLEIFKCKFEDIFLD